MSEKNVVVKNGDVLPFGVALYHATCKCGQELPWEADFDADGTTYHAECCGLYYSMFTKTVDISVEKCDAD